MQLKSVIVFSFLLIFQQINLVGIVILIESNSQDKNKILDYLEERRLKVVRAPDFCWKMYFEYQQPNFNEMFSRIKSLNEYIQLCLDTVEQHKPDEIVVIDFSIYSVLDFLMKQEEYKKLKKRRFTYMISSYELLEFLPENADFVFCFIMKNNDENEELWNKFYYSKPEPIKLNAENKKEMRAKIKKLEFRNYLTNSINQNIITELDDKNSGFENSKDSDFNDVYFSTFETVEDTELPYESIYNKINEILCKNMKNSISSLSLNNQ